MTYARSTTVSATRTRNEIEETLERYGADGFAYDTQGNLATPSMWGLHPCRPGPSGTTQVVQFCSAPVVEVQGKCPVKCSAEMSYSPYGECGFESKRTGKTSGPEQFAR